MTEQRDGSANIREPRSLGPSQEVAVGVQSIPASGGSGGILRSAKDAHSWLKSYQQG